MSKDPFQIPADELTLIRKDMDRLQRTSLNKNEAEALHQVVADAATDMQRATREGPDDPVRHGSRHRGRRARPGRYPRATGPRARKALIDRRRGPQGGLALVRRVLGVGWPPCLPQGPLSGRWRCPRVRAASKHLLRHRRWTGGRTGQWVQLLRHLDQQTGSVKNQSG